MKCDFVIMNLWGLPNSRHNLSRRVQNHLRYGRFVHDVDPCLLEQGHDGEHLLRTMRQPDPQNAHDAD